MAPDRPDDAAPVLLYDGACGLCARSVQFLLARERPGRSVPMRFAPLEGAYARHVRATAPWIAAVDSVVWVVPRVHGPPEVAVRSTAALLALAALGGPWRLLAALGRLVPRRLRDAAYDAVARRRHRLFAARCLLPSPAHRERFLD